MDTSAVYMNCLKDNLNFGMILLSEVVQHPSFEEVEFEKLLRQTKTSLSIQEQTPEYLVSKHLNEILFGEHPYARTSLGSSHDLDQLTVEDLKQWWETYAVPTAATLIFAGDISKKEAVSLAEKYLGQWDSQAVATSAIAAPAETKPTTIYLVDRPGSAQAQIQVGQLGLTRKEQPEYFISLLAGSYFGGSFHSRLNENIRVKRGLTYGAWGSYRARNFEGTFEISTYTKNESAAETIRVILEQIDDFRTIEPTDAEFYDNRSYFIGSFARNRETPQAIARDLWLIESQQLGENYFKDLFKTLDKTDKEDCVRLAAETIDPETLAIVVVGDAEKLKESLSSIAPIQIIKPDNAKEQPSVITN